MDQVSTVRTARPAGMGSTARPTVLKGRRTTVAIEGTRYVLGTLVEPTAPAAKPATSGTTALFIATRPTLGTGAARTGQRYVSTIEPVRFNFSLFRTYVLTFQDCT